MSRTSAPVFPCSCPEGWKPEGWAYCAGCYEGQIERLRTETGRLRAIVRVNLMRCEGATHEEIDAILDPVSTSPGRDK